MENITFVSRLNPYRLGKLYEMVKPTEHRKDIYFPFTPLNPRHFFSHKPSNANIIKFTPQSAFAFLGLSINSSPEECRAAYIKMAKDLHPDVAQGIARNSAAFQRLQEAYRVALTTTRKNQEDENTKSKDSWLEHQQHRAPQHRHYLETESRSTTLCPMVTGLTPSERQRQLQTQRFVEAAYTSSDYRVARICDSMTQYEDRSELVPASEGGDAHRRPLQLKSINLIERIADDLIQEAMKRGEFDNLSGLGQPLTMSTSSHEAFQDPSTVRLTRILANQGYLPEWIQQGKESREQWKAALNKLQTAHAKLCPSGQPRNKSAWDAAVKEFENEVMKINRSIDRYNLLVPALHLQRCHINVSDAVKCVLSSTTAESTKSNSPTERTKENGKSNNESIKEDGGNSKGTKDKEDIWSMTYMAEIMRDFYRELVRAYVSMLRGFKNHK
ncbi:hypothetical protein EG68_06312 [Paragonimus skrjabini miyazakii]|uniref:J domain-containing protein n=1 Tax=Paragonimus skrjabini miyazakii TaxID=59628 RepID=A0A8S9YT78_9TREM|nr:hypothetical protein EG68_06312 [Paragonimus skrjabini miyazakii]